MSSVSKNISNGQEHEREILERQTKVKTRPEIIHPLDLLNGGVEVVRKAFYICIYGMFQIFFISNCKVLLIFILKPFRKNVFKSHYLLYLKKKVTNKSFPMSCYKLCKLVWQGIWYRPYISICIDKWI